MQKDTVWNNDQLTAIVRRLSERIEKLEPEKEPGPIKCRVWFLDNGDGGFVTDIKYCTNETDAIRVIEPLSSFTVSTAIKLKQGDNPGCLNIDQIVDVLDELGMIAK